MARTTSRIDEMSFQDRVLAVIKRPMDVDKIAERTKLTERQVRTSIDRLRASGYDIENSARRQFRLVG